MMIGNRLGGSRGHYANYENKQMHVSPILQDLHTRAQYSKTSPRTTVSNGTIPFFLGVNSFESKSLQLGTLRRPLGQSTWFGRFFVLASWHQILWWCPENLVALIACLWSKATGSESHRLPGCYQRFRRGAFHLLGNQPAEMSILPGPGRPWAANMNSKVDASYPDIPDA